MGVEKGGAGRPWILKLLAKKGCFFNFEGQKPNFTTFAPSLKKIWGKSPTALPLEKILPTPMGTSMVCRMCT